MLAGLCAALLLAQSSSKGVDPKLQPEARGVLDYLHSIYGKKVIYGQSTNTGVGIGDWPNLEAMNKASGKYPAMLCIDIHG